MAARGAAVVCCARRTDRLQQLVSEITSAGGNALAVNMDVTSADSIAAAFDAAEQAFGTVTVVANNAGVEQTKKAMEIDQAGWDFVMNTNLKGVWLVAQEAARRMVTAGVGGSIVNTASILGLRVAPMLSTYAISKGAVVQLTKTLALEWSRNNIRVNALCPGYFVTEMNQDFFASEKGQAYIQRTPTKRTGEMDDITAPFLLLASDAGSFVNGVALPVDGAHSIANL
jgi:NAD(P)-dependent dehydrogenase (short-subunit alcohol dehydrogenase family)